MKKIIITIDGYSACGKSTTAKICADRLNYTYIDTGAMYRAVALYFKQNYIDKTNPKAVEAALDAIQITFQWNPKKNQSDVFLNGLNVEDEIRQMYISEMVSEVSSLVSVRRHLVKQQQKMGKKKGIVMDGRDIGTVVFPEAELKIFMRADDYIRAERRQKELLEKKQVVDLDEVLNNIRKRDFIDSNREEGALKKADDAYILDSSYMTLDEQVDYILNLCNSKLIQSYKDTEAEIKFSV